MGNPGVIQQSTMNPNMVNNELYMEVKHKWRSIYPIYFDSSKTLQQGRRVPINKCVKEPTLQELVRAVCACQLRNIVEPHRCYSRDYFQMGRMKVQLTNDSGKPVVPAIPSKKKMLQHIGQALVQLRQQK